MTVEVNAGGAGEEAAEAAEAGAEAAEAAAEAAEAVAEAAEAVADAAAEVADDAEGGEGGGDGHTDGDLEQAAALGALAQSHNDHLAAEHPTTDDMRAVARSVLWEEAQALAEYAAAEAEAQAPDEGETIVVPDVTESDKRETGLRRFL